MTDTKTRNTPSATADEQDQGAEATAPGTTDSPVDTEPTQSLTEAIEAADEQASAADAFYATPFAIPGPPEASLDGAWLAYLQADADGQARLWISPTDGGEPRALDLPFTPVEDRDPESGRLLRGPQWSPAGSQIAVTGMHPDGDRTAIWLVPSGVAGDAEADVAEPVVTPEEATADDAVDVDADAMMDETGVAEDAAEPVGAEDAATVAESVDPVTPAPRLLVDHAGADRSPRWSPDGEILAFTSTIDGRDVIALAPATSEDASALELLTWSASNDREPVWSRDGKFLAFARQRLDGPDHADICVFSLEKGELTNLTQDKASAIRHSLEWVPGRNLIAYVTRETDWLSISVINADNKAGWTVTRESGDKTEPRFAAKEARLVYVRTEGFTTVLCERGLHASSAIAIDPGEGVARYPRWLAEKRVAYGFSAPQRPFGVLAQDNLADADRTVVQIPGAPSASGQRLQQPVPFEFEVGPEEQFSGMLYQTSGVAGKVPALVYLPDGPLQTRRGEFQVEEQALASTALTVLTPVIHGASGFGAPVEDDLRELATTELEASDLAEAGRALGAHAGIDPQKLALIGSGYGGTLALVTAGARPGVYASVVAIDPITDWSIELANTDVAWRNWVTGRFGLPLTDADHYALRTPSTFSAIIDVPLTLVRTANAPEHRAVQFDLFVADLDASGVAYEVVDVPEQPLAATLREISRRLTRSFLGGADEAEIVQDIRASDLE
jgi:dipeptidyl aminopeptidase/acylaminoacyl peptidase